MTERWRLGVSERGRAGWTSDDVRALTAALLGRALLCVVLESHAGNAACEHSVGLMSQRPTPWWRGLGAL